jgi:hypothetical protein
MPAEKPASKRDRKIKNERRERVSKPLLRAGPALLGEA